MSDVFSTVLLTGWAQNIEKPLLPYGYAAMLTVMPLCVWIKMKRNAEKPVQGLSFILSPSLRAWHILRGWLQPAKKPTPAPDKIPGDPQLIRQILNPGPGRKTILLAGSCIESLPIHIAVKNAVAVAQAGKKCLLIDLDTRRNAAAQVFDIKPAATNKPGPVATCCENLFVWPAAFFSRFAQTNLQNIVRSATAKFDIILLNAPYLDGNPDRRQIASVADCSLVFCRQPARQKRLLGLMNACGCRVIACFGAYEPSNNSPPPAASSISQTTLSSAGQSK